MKKTFSTLFRAIALLTIINSPATPQPQSIVALVNDRPISRAEFEAQLSITISSMDLPNNKQTFDELAPHVLKLMILEELKLQTALTHGIEIPDKEINHALKEFKQRASDSLNKKLEQDKIFLGVVQKHNHASIAWLNYIRARYEPLVQVTEEEINLHMARIAASKKEEQARLAEIFLSIDDSEDEAEVLNNAQKTVERIHKGARFSALAKEFSVAPSAINGGDIGWIAPSRLDKALQDAITRTKIGEVTPPIRTKGGFHILLVIDKRKPGESIDKDTLVTFNNAIIKIANRNNRDEINQAILHMRAITEHAKSCNMLSNMVKNDKSIDLLKVNKTSVQNLPIELRKLLENLTLNRPSELIFSGEEVMFFMVCAKEDINPQEPSYDEVKNMLIERKLTSIALRELRALYKSAHIVINNN